MSNVNFFAVINETDFVIFFVSFTVFLQHSFVILFNAFAISFASYWNFVLFSCLRDNGIKLLIITLVLFLLFILFCICCNYWNKIVINNIVIRKDKFKFLITLIPLHNVCCECASMVFIMFNYHWISLIFLKLYFYLTANVQNILVFWIFLKIFFLIFNF